MPTQQIEYTIISWISFFFGVSKDTHEKQKSWKFELCTSFRFHATAILNLRGVISKTGTGVKFNIQRAISRELHPSDHSNLVFWITFCCRLQIFDQKKCTLLQSKVIGGQKWLKIYSDHSLGGHKSKSKCDIASKFGLVIANLTNYICVKFCTYITFIGWDIAVAKSKMCILTWTWPP